MVQKLLNFGKNGQNCLLSAVSKIFPTLDANNSPMKKAMRLKFGPAVALMQISLFYQLLLKMLSCGVKFCQICQKIHF